MHQNLPDSVDCLNPKGNQKQPEKMARKAGGRKRICQINKGQVQSEPFRSRFFRFIQMNQSGCWNWTGHKNKDGYGFISLNGRPRLATRISFVMHGGIFEEGKDLVCHHCDNPSCVNPDHLWAGSNKDNMKDAKEKGRVKKGDSHYARIDPSRLPHGENHWLCKVSDEQVREIRLLKQQGIKCPDIARMFGISRSRAYAIASSDARKFVA